MGIFSTEVSSSQMNLVHIIIKRTVSNLQYTDTVLGYVTPTLWCGSRFLLIPAFRVFHVLPSYPPTMDLASSASFPESLIPR